MEEVIDADRVVVMDDGHVVMEGTPKEIFSQVETLKKISPGCATGNFAGT